MKGFNNHQDEFAKAWQDAFADAEHTPGEGVWDGIHESLAGDASAAALSSIFDEVEHSPGAEVWDKVEAALAQDEAAMYKRKMHRYQYLAAAAIALLLLLGGRSLYRELPVSLDANSPVMVSIPQDFGPLNTGLSNSRTEGSQTSTRLLALSQPAEQSITAVNSADRMLSSPSSRQQVPVSFTSGKIPNNEQLGQEEADLVHMISSLSVSDSNDDLSLAALEGKAGFLAFDQNQPKVKREIFPNPTFVDIPDFQKEVIRSASSFASLAVNSGLFTPNYSSGGSAPFSGDSRAVNAFTTSNPNAMAEIQSLGKETNAGLSGSVGLQVGVPLAEKWIALVGASLGSYQATGTSNFVYEIPETNERVPASASTYRALNESFENQYRTTLLPHDYEITETFQYVSVPVQVGYKLASSKKLDWWVIGGGSADIFLRHSLTSDVDEYLSTQFKAGDELSPYNPVVVSGTLGTDVSYQLSPNWSISVQPSLKMAVNSLVKKGEPVSGNPAFFDLGFRLKYHIQ